MRPLLLPVALAAALLALASPARAATIITLTLDPTQSTLTPDVGAAETLSGTLTLAIGALLLGGSSTSFDVVGLAVSASGGATIALDPGIANPGLGVLAPSGLFLIPTLYVRITQGPSVDLPIPDVEGSALFGPGGVSITRVATSFGLDTGAPAGIVTVSLVAVPEPASAALLAFGLGALCARRGRPEIVR